MYSIHILYVNSINVLVVIKKQTTCSRAVAGILACRQFSISCVPSPCAIYLFATNSTITCRRWICNRPVKSHAFGFTRRPSLSVMVGETIVHM